MIDESPFKQVMSLSEMSQSPEHAEALERSEGEGERSHILRLGRYDRANLLPLLYPIEAGWVAPDSPWTVEVVNAAPGALVKDTLQGDLDAAFLPPAALARHGERLSLVGSWGLASEGKVGTALLLAPQRLDLMHEGAVSIVPEALGSTAEHLLRVLLEPYYSIEVAIHAPGDERYNPVGARLLYGDDAARQAAKMPNGWVAEDLGLAWWVLTGLPMVWEMLAAPRDLEERKPGAGRQLQELVKLSQRTAQEQQTAIHEVADERLGYARSDVKELFSRQRYTLGEEQQKGLARFLDMASRK